MCVCVYVCGDEAMWGEELTKEDRDKEQREGYSQEGRGQVQEPVRGHGEQS